MRLGHILASIRREDDGLPLLSNGRPIGLTQVRRDGVVLSTVGYDWALSVGELRGRLEGYAPDLPVYVGEWRVVAVDKPRGEDSAISLFAPPPRGRN